MSVLLLKLVFCHLNEKIIIDVVIAVNTSMLHAILLEYLVTVSWTVHLNLSHMLSKLGLYAATAVLVLQSYACWRGVHIRHPTTHFRMIDTLRCLVLIGYAVKDARDSHCRDF